MAWLTSAGHAAGQATKELTPQEKRGKQIYLKGESDGGEIVAILGRGELELPAASFPCSNCHGLRGEGSKEGGIQPPPLDWASLSSPHQSMLTRNDRGPYTDVSLARAINSGLDSSGGRLHSGMPRYRMTAAQMDGLIAYLKKIDTESDLDPGLTEDAIRMGAALPMSGPLARLGEDIKATLGACFAEVNSHGGIYGRRLELLVEDSGGDAKGAAQATRKLVEQAKVFALLASFEPPGDETNEFLRQSEVTLIGPVTLSPRLPVVPNRYVFYLLPSFGEQARSLVDFVGSEETRPKGRPASRLAVVYTEGDFDRDALAGLRLQSKLYSMQLVSEQSYKSGALSAAVTVASLAAKKPDYIFFFGGAGDMTSFAAEMDRAKLDAGVLSSAVMLGEGAFSLPPAVAARTYLSYPVSLPAQAGFADFVAAMQKAGVNLRSAAFQAVAYASAKIFIEAVKNTDRQLSRAALVNSLERLQDFRTGVIGPVTFGPNRRVGAAGSYIVGIDLKNKQYVAVSERIVPKAVVQ